MGQYWFGQTLIIRWREWMTQRYVALWMAEGRHYRIRFVDQSVDNIHLRIANDVLLFIQRTHELGTGLLHSVVALLSFAYILWGISAIAPLPLFGVDLAFPGYLVVLALGYAAHRHAGRAPDRLAAHSAAVPPAALRVGFPFRHRARHRPCRAGRADARRGGRARRAAHGVSARWCAIGSRWSAGRRG